MFSSCTNENLCVVSIMKNFLQKTKTIRNGFSSLWVTSTHPLKPASKDTITRWIRNISQEAVLGDFTPHSLRAAGASKGARFLSLDTVLSAGGWSIDSVFRKFYNSPICSYAGIDKLFVLFC